MIYREISIPKFLHEIHGEKTRLSSKILTYTASLVAAALVASQLIKLLPLFKVVVIAVLYLDIAGGVVANLSTSTNQYYQEKIRFRVFFLIMHIIQPAIFIWVLQSNKGYFLYTFSYTILTALIVNMIKDMEYQQNLASFFIVIGIVISFFFTLQFPILYTFAPLYMIKLILGFSVKRPSLIKS